MMWSRTAAQTTGPRGILHLLRTERRMLWLIAGVGLLAVALALAMQRQFNWPPFLGGYIGTLGLAAVGGYVRQAKGAPRIALALVGTSIFTGFTAVSSLFIFALFPLPNPLIDPTLIKLDAALGY